MLYTSQMSRATLPWLGRQGKMRKDVYKRQGQDVPFYGLYGACSTMAESLSLAALLLDGGFGGCAAAMTSSHFCSAERQYRTPLEYGGQRTPTAQWTVTGSGCVILSAEGAGPRVTHVTTRCV